MPPMVITSQDKWLLTLIGSIPYVRGSTRLQKYGILVYRGIFNNSEFFDDWQSGKYGMFSQKLAVSLEKLENEGYVAAYDTFDLDKKRVKNYILTYIGTILKNKWIADKTDIAVKVAHAATVYFNKPLKELSKDTCEKFPEFTDKNISTKVRKERMDEISLLDSEFNSQNKKNNSTKPSILIKKHVFNDKDFRLKLAKSIGYDEILPLDPASFDKLKGLFADRIDTKHFDTVELIKESRGD